LPQDFWPQLLIRDDPELFRWGKPKQPRHRLLNHRLLAIQRKQLLGAFLAAKRPETCATSAGEDHGIEVGAH